MQIIFAFFCCVFVVGWTIRHRITKRENGFPMSREFDMAILSIGSDARTKKGLGMGYLTGIIYLSPSVRTCPFASKSCMSACLYHSGRGKMGSVQYYRQKRTSLFYDDNNAFLLQLKKEIDALLRKAKKNNLKPCIRLNGTSDIDWENIPFLGKKNIFAYYPRVQFYDYTKRPISDRSKNHHFTFSWSGENEIECNNAINNGFNIAVPFYVKKGEDLPDTFLGLPVIDGDISDIRFKDKKGVVVGLRVKKNKNTDKPSKFIVNLKVLGK